MILSVARVEYINRGLSQVRPEAGRANSVGEVLWGYSWLCSLVVRTLDSLLDGFNPWPPRQILGSMTVFAWANHLSISPIHPGKLSLLPSAGREMSKFFLPAKVRRRCAAGVKGIRLIPLVDKREGGR